jgi:hypothetical protein
VTVGYERARGLRAVHETSRGFEVSVSRTLRVPTLVAWKAVSDRRRRAAWLDPDVFALVRSTAGKSARFRVIGSSSTVNLTLDQVDPDGSRLTVTHTKLVDADVVAERRTEWRARLDRLVATFADPAKRASGRVAASTRRAS